MTEHAVSLPKLLADELERVAASQEKIAEEWRWLQARQKDLKGYLDGPLASPNIRATGTTNAPHWVVWIPPHSLAHFDGDAIVGPWGDTYFDTLEEASTFLASVMADLANPDEVQ